MCVICQDSQYPHTHFNEAITNLRQLRSKQYTCCECGRIHYSVERYRGIGLLCERCSENYAFCAHCQEYHPKVFMTQYKEDWICDAKYGEKFIKCEACGFLEEINSIYTLNDESLCKYCYRSNLAYACRDIGNDLHGESFETIKSSRWYGVEIETACGDYTGVPKDWGIKLDESIAGLELVSPLMKGDEGLQSIRDLYRDVAPRFDNCCGIHIHVDVRDLFQEQLVDLVKAFKNTKKTWFRKVAYRRHNNRFCRGEVAYPKGTWHEFKKTLQEDRYCWVNFIAVRHHGSVEIRLFEGTEDVDKVCDWVTMTVNFVEQVVNMYREMETNVVTK